MKLKGVKYKNYGCMVESEESEDPFSNNFFQSSSPSLKPPSPAKSFTTRIFFMPLNIGN